MSFISPARKGSILHIDIECRPLSWYAGDMVSKEITAIAAKFKGKNKVHLWLLGKHSPEEMADGFIALYEKADMISGHHVRGFDLPTINSFLLELGKRPLSSKLVSDTKNDLIKFQGHSKSQESLSAMLGLQHPKIAMNQSAWRNASRLTKQGLALVKERVVGDVLQHEELRERLIQLNALGPPRMWYNTGVINEVYIP